MRGQIVGDLNAGGIRRSVVGGHQGVDDGIARARMGLLMVFYRRSVTRTMLSVSLAVLLPVLISVTRMAQR